MPRARNIKPSIFKNEILGEADPILTILFIGLWTLADREGRLEDRPKRIKAELLPYRDCQDFNGYLTELERLGFIHRYIVENDAYIQIKNFKKHQSPHKTEKASEIPEPPSESTACTATVKTPLFNGSRHVKESLIPDSSNTDRGARKRATAIPKDFQITEEMKAWAAENKMRFDLGAETSKFRDYHAAKGSTFKDWTAAWRNWMRKAVEFRGPVDDEGAASVPPQAPPGCNQSDYEAMDSDSRVAAWERWNAHISKVRGVA